jgi:hypothetical protein
MRGDYIDFISAYCDRWCERCALTSRCSAYTVQIATAMCDGDFEAGIELAVGAPPPANEAERKQREQFLEQLTDFEPTREEMAALQREEEERNERVEESPITTLSGAVWLLAHRWLDDHRGRTSQKADSALADALEIAGWDCFFIPAKLHRALGGRDEAEHGERFDEDPIQNDWNGSAKVALISIDRSTTAWDVIAQSTGDADARHIAEELRNLRREVEQAFPAAWKFSRPGFDQ